tara:strand:- start:5168 stop:5773 length:606 start_codon:yes stop_codon:yes gene_type:complete
MNSSLGYAEIVNQPEREKKDKSVLSSSATKRVRTFKKRSMGNNVKKFLNSMHEEYLPEKTIPVPDEEDEMGASWVGGNPPNDNIKKHCPVDDNTQGGSMLREGMEQQREHYRNQENYTQKPTYSGMGENIQHYTELTNGGEITNPKEDLMVKLNYVVHMLEEQQDQKTGSVTEEMVLYMFLGVFVIFVVDSFSKTGKYRRG